MLIGKIFINVNEEVILVGQKQFSPMFVKK